jgi:hypothetical protein
MLSDDELMRAAMCHVECLETAARVATAAGQKALEWGKAEGRRERGQEIVKWLKDIAVRLDYADAGNLAVRLKAWLAQQGEKEG